MSGPIDHDFTDQEGMAERIEFDCTATMAINSRRRGNGVGVEGGSQPRSPNRIYIGCGGATRCGQADDRYHRGWRRDAVAPSVQCAGGILVTDLCITSTNSKVRSHSMFAT